MNWLERARREIGGSARQRTANTVEGNPTTAMAVLDGDRREELAASIGSNGSALPARIQESEALREAFQEHAATMEYDGHMTRDDAERAQKALGIEAVKPGMKEPWMWKLPPKVLKSAEDAQEKTVSTFGVNEHLREPPLETSTAESATGRQALRRDVLMGAPEVLQSLRGQGFKLTVDGDKLFVEPRDRLTDDIRATIRANKPALLEAITGGAVAIQDRPPANMTPTSSDRQNDNLEARIRLMADWWGYSGDELATALERAANDPAAWRDFVADDERWRARHPDRRPTVH